MAVNRASCPDGARLFPRSSDGDVLTGVLATVGGMDAEGALVGVSSQAQLLLLSQAFPSSFTSSRGFPGVWGGCSRAAEMF